MDDALILLTHHVEVAVQYQRCCVLKAELAGLAHQDAVQIILLRLEAALLGKLHDPLGSLLLIG